MSTYLPTELRRLLETADDHQCAYCQTTQDITGQPMVLDHIVPEVKGGRLNLLISVLLADAVMNSKVLQPICRTR